jgi:hypothetical protein
MRALWDSRLCCIPLVFAAALTGCGGGGGSKSGGAAPIAGSTPKIGAISYWSLTTPLYDQLPSGAVAVVNPYNGIFAGQTTTLTTDTASYAAIVTNATARNVVMLGYVPTGYFNHACTVSTSQCQTWARIEAQVQAYFQNMPGVAGIFFDETSMSPWNCGNFVAEFQQLRAIVHKYNAQARIAFNVAGYDPCVVDAVSAGEILVQYESDAARYLSQASAIDAGVAAAQAKGVIPWHLVFATATTADLDSVYAQAAAGHVSLFYATDKSSGSNVWNSLPVYWQHELALLGY